MTYPPANYTWPFGKATLGVGTVNIHGITEDTWAENSREDINVF